MTRTVLVLLAALAAGIGLVLGRPLLYAAAAVLVLAAIGLWVRDWRKERRRERRKTEARAKAASGDDDLQSLGIMEIRPREEKSTPEEAASPEDTSTEEASPVQEPSEETSPEAAPASPPTEPSHAEPSHAQEEPDEHEERRGEKEAPPPAEPSAEKEEVHQEETPPEHAPPAAEEGARRAEAPPPAAGGEAQHQPGRTDALAALMRALRLATDARVACLLTQEEWAHEYRIEALDAEAEAPPLKSTGDTFSTEEPLLSAGATRRPVTRHPVGDAGLGPRNLGYYQQPAAHAPKAVALVPIPLPDDPTTQFLLLDGPRGAFDAHDALLERFAKLFAQMTAGGGRSAISGGSQTSSAARTPPASPPSSSESRSTEERARTPENGRAATAQREEAQREESSPRPRREIVAEEMQRAQRAGRALALALVYLNRAETVAEHGEDEVQAAERALRARLRQAVPDDGRVERFGELTFGVFLLRGSTEAERWAVALQEEMAQASDPLEGGVSVGLALMRSAEQAPEALRKNATNALREAYTTGTCTILE